jgi:hypothetical protein
MSPSWQRAAASNLRPAVDQLAGQRHRLALIALDPDRFRTPSLCLDFFLVPLPLIATSPIIPWRRRANSKPEMLVMPRSLRTAGSGSGAARRERERLP